MKQTKILVSIILTVLMVVGWTSALLGNDTEEKSEYDTHMVMAEKYIDKGLFQKAIEEYNDAISIKNTENAWASVLNAYEKRYEESTEIYDEYLGAAKQAASFYITNAAFTKRLVNLHLKKEDYKSAYKSLMKAVNAGVTDPVIEEFLNKVKYAFKIEWQDFSDVQSCTNGYYAVSQGGKWSYLSLNGQGAGISNLSFAGPVGDDGIRVIYEEKRGQFIDSEEVVQGVVEFVPEDAGMYSEGLVAVKNNGKYSYFDLIGDKQFGRYKAASSFTNGKAAVKDKQWYLIDNKGEKTGSGVYDEIVLNSDSSYIRNGVMIAKKNGSYHLFDEEEKQIGKFSCSEIDMNTGNGWIAFCTDGKWGFADEEGNVTIKPAYVGAKSFSYGLAAVSDGKKWGFINTKGELVIDYQFLDVDYFNSEGCSMVKTGKDVWQLLSLYITEDMK